MFLLFLGVKKSNRKRPENSDVEDHEGYINKLATGLKEGTIGQEDTNAGSTEQDHELGHRNR